MKKYNFSIDLDIPVLNLSAGQKQKVDDHAAKAAEVIKRFVIVRD